MRINLIEIDAEPQDLSANWNPGFRAGRQLLYTGEGRGT